MGTSKSLSLRRDCDSALRTITHHAHVLSRSLNRNVEELLEYRTLRLLCMHMCILRRCCTRRYDFAGSISVYLIIYNSRQVWTSIP